MSKKIFNVALRSSSLLLLFWLLRISSAPARANGIAVVAGEVGVNDNGLCSLVEALANANDTATGLVYDDCPPGSPSGVDAVILPPNGSFSLTGVHSHLAGDTGLPLISSRIIIRGNGSTIERAGGGPAFRLLAVDSAGDLSLADVVLSGGRLAGGLEKGGGVLNQGRLTIANSTISANVSEGGGGGVSNAGTLSVTNSTIAANESGGAGGGLENMLGGALTVKSSTISANKSGGDGGGVFNAGTLTVTNSTISGNGAGNAGGGFFNERSLYLSYSTITGNQAGVEAGGVYCNAENRCQLSRVIISGNIAPTGNEIVVVPLTEFRFDDSNLIGHAGLSYDQAVDTRTFIGDFDTITLATSDQANIPLEAILDPTLADNGGATQTHALVPGSPAIDAASTSSCIDTPADVDQRGRPRNTDGDLLGDSNRECDLGAFELQLARLTIVKKLIADNNLVQDFPFEGPTGSFTLTTNTAADHHTLDPLLPGTYTFRENPPRYFGLLGVMCVDSRGQDVTEATVNSFYIVMSADITLAEDDDLTCTFFNQRATAETDEANNRLYLPLVSGAHGSD